MLIDKKYVTVPVCKICHLKLNLMRQGKIIMSPTKVYHSVFQGELSALLKAHKKEGKVLAECVIWTYRGTKASNVA